MRTMAVVNRIIRQMLRDKRALALMMVAPLLIITLLHYIFSVDEGDPQLGVAQIDEVLLEQLKDKDVKVMVYEKIEDPEKTLKDDNLDGILQEKDGNLNLYLQNDWPSTAKSLQIKVQQAIATQKGEEQEKNLKTFLENIQKKMPNLPVKLEQAETQEMDVSYLYGNKDSYYIDILSPILIGFFVFFFVFLISGMALLKERTTGTLERLMSTPIRRRDLVFGYMLGYGLFAVIQTIIVVFFAIEILDITLAGSLWHVILINIIIALVALTLGILLSAFANSEFQMMQFIPLVILPQIFFAGILPVDEMAGWLQVLAKFMPMYYGGNALTDIMYKGFGLNDILFDLLILISFALLFTILNLFALKKYRKI